jgi:hypothetical protein
MQNSYSFNDFVDPSASARNNSDSSLNSIIHTIFTKPVQRPNTYQLEFEEPTNTTFQQQTQYIFNQLCYILKKGCFILYPHAYNIEEDKIISSRLTPQNFLTIKQYFESFGYTIKNRIVQNIQLHDSDLIDESFIDSLVNHEIDFDNDNELNLSSLPSLPDNENLVKDKIKNELKDYVYRIEDSTRNITIEITWNYLKN